MRLHLVRGLVLAVASLVLAACGGGGGGGGPKGSDNTVAASVAPAGAVSVYLNKSQSISITFATSDGASASALRANGLASLPAGWTGPVGGFECPSLGAGATCTLTLQYLPTAPATGTLVLGFSYRANNGAAKQGSVSIDYSGLSPTLELLAGSIGGYGNLDGTGATARFTYPHGVAVDSAGDVYVPDSTMVRKVTREGVVTTLAGAYGEYGFADGAGAAARFSGISGIAVDRGGTLYVTDADTIRKISPQGVVTTLAGSPNLTSPYACRFADGVGAAAAFCAPNGVAVDRGGTVYVADTQNALIRKITPGGVVSTLAGSLVRPRPCDPYNPCTPGPSTHCPTCPLCPSVDGIGGAAGFGYPSGISVDDAGTAYVVDRGPGNSKIRKITPTGVVTTLAGRAGSGSADGTGDEAAFWDPQGIAVDGSGALYVADLRNNTIRRITPEGVVTTLAGKATERGGSDDGTGSDARFLSPAGVAVDAAGVVYVADQSNATIRKITPAGVVTTFVGEAPKSGFANDVGAAARFNWPEGVAVDRTGVAYVTDCSNFAIRKVAPSGVVTTLAGSPDRYGFADGTVAEARFSCPSGISVDGGGTVYVTDTQTVRKVTPDGTVTTLAGTARAIGSADGTGPAAQFGFASPTGIAVDDAGMLYVSDSGNSTIRRVTNEGVVTTLAGLAGERGAVDGVGAAARFGGPSGIAIDLGRRIFVTDSGTTIRKLDPPDIVTTLAGTAGERGDADGMGADSRFGSAGGIAIDATGNLYVTDGWNHTIRKVTPAGVVTTILGERGSVGIRLGSLPASLSWPSSVAVRPDGQLLILDGNAILVTRGL